MEVFGTWAKWPFISKLAYKSESHHCTSAVNWNWKINISSVIAESVAELEKGSLAPSSLLLRKLHFSVVIEKFAHLCPSTFSQKMCSSARLPLWVLADFKWKESRLPCSVSSICMMTHNKGISEIQISWVGRSTSAAPSAIRFPDKNLQCWRWTLIQCSSW